MNFNDTICAPATPSGGALGIIRISGENSYKILSGLIQFPTASKNLEELDANTTHFARVVDGDVLVDEVILSLFRNPHSYTGEDMIEISCHGSEYIQKKILELLVTQGCRMARPGEFTQRAFLNGKMDLSQAEAVADLIASESESSHRIAINQMRGGFSQELKKMRDELLNFVSLVELELDFSEEDVEFANRDNLKQLIDNLLSYTGSLKDSFRMGNVLKNGVPVAIVGKPNVGKSTLLNALLKEEKAIVSEIEGTTRDAIEDTVVIEGITFRFIDTAGIRETADIIENLGIRKTYQKIEHASVVLLLEEAVDDPENIIKAAETIQKQIEGKDKEFLLIINKTDLAGDDQLKALTSKLQSLPVIYLSAKKSKNLQTLTSALLNAAHLKDFNNTGTVISNLRHYEALSNAHQALQRVTDGIENQLTTDLLAQDIREALYYLGEITGEITTDEILGNIFRNFCIGK
jgi:tRNA modification GTPase